MKRLICVVTVCLLTMGLLCSLPVSAEGGLSVTASAATVTVGQNVTVTVTYDGGGQPIGGIDGNLLFDTNVFSYVSFAGSDVQANGGAGKMRFIFSPSGAQAPTSLTLTFTFKAEAPGSCDFTVSTEEFVNDTDYGSLGAPSGGVTITAGNPTLSGNADLKSLVPSRGTLSPKFSPDVTEYTVSVANSVTSVSLSATADHSGAKTSISGKNALEVGKNTRVITVTAPNGTTKKYTVVITRAAAPSTTVGTNTPTTGTTTPLPPDDALEVSVDGKAMTILDTQAAADLPDGFQWSNLTVNLVEVPAAVNEQTGMTLLYLVSEDGKDDGFYIYDASADSFARFRVLKVAGSSYLLYDPPTDAGFNGTVWGTLVYEGGSVSALLYEDGTLSDFCIVWAAPAEGETGWYTYDTKEGTLQRYHATPSGDESVNAPTATTPNSADDTDESEKDKDAFALSSFFKEHRRILLIGIIAVAGVAVLVILFLLIASGGPKKGKH